MRASRVLRGRDDENNAYFTRQTSCHVVDKAESRVDHFSEISLPLMIIISYNMIALPSSFCLVVYLTINHGQCQRCREIERFKLFDGDANCLGGSVFFKVFSSDRSMYYKFDMAKVKVIHRKHHRQVFMKEAPVSVIKHVPLSQEASQIEITRLV